ncbi:SHOCT domain-containing protein [Escherichia coli]|nr:SHOCT domain-containing protein [Escherichia coli]EJI1860928.1 SHOCT domain-containing protein [Escherichia coli]
MANSRYDVEIRGDNKGLSTAVKKSMDDLGKLDDAANGLFSDLAGPLGNLGGGLDSLQALTPTMRALGAAGLAASVGVQALSSAMEKVNELNTISTSTGVSIEMLQQLQKEFKNTGLEIDKFGDINKDAMDHLGDSFRNGGGGIADDLKEWGIGLEKFTQYASDAQGGIKAVIDLFYQMKDAGKSQAEITNAMESLASDSSHLISTLEQYKNAQEALNHIQSQSVSITSETAAEYKEFDKNIKTLSSNVDSLTVNVMAPLVEELNKLWELANKDWDKSTLLDFFSMINSYRPDNIISNFGADYVTENYLDQWFPDTPGAIKRRGEQQTEAFVKASKDGYDASRKAAKQREEKAKIDKKIAEKESEERQKELDKASKERERAERERKSAADKAAREREQAAREAKTAYDKMMADRKTAIDSLTALDVAVIAQEARSYASQTNQLQQSLGKLQELRDQGYLSEEQFLQRRNALLSNASKEFTDSLKANPADIGVITKSLNEMFVIQQQELEIKRQQNLISQQQYNEQLENLETDHQAKLKAIKDINASEINMRNLNSIGFATDEEKMALEQEALKQQFELFNEQNNTMYQNGLLSHEQFLEQKRRLDKAYSVQSENIAMMEIQTKMGMYNGFAQGMAGVISGISGENSKAAQAAFAVAKGTAIANGMLNAYQSATKAMATYPGPLGYALAASSYAQVLGQVMSMKSVNMTGMAHDGISEIPREGTWLLDGGERVVDQRTNGDLKDFLNNQSESKTQPIDARVIVQGNVTDQRWFAEQLKKQEKIITSIVQSGNRRKM